jgi:phospholipid/cholesterol/gamma-HCH transport system ATP-binding protein
MIEINNINKRFEGDSQQTLTDISAQFFEGTTNLIIGRSGSGKTVLMKCLIGLLVPDTGSIRYDGRDFLSLDKNELLALRQEMGVLFQGSALFDSMSVLGNVCFPLEIFTSMSSKARRKRALECLERVGMADAADKKPSEISGGMQKRVAIARAIVLKPRYLFCDEPNSGLDPTTSMIIDELIYSITKESSMTTIVNTHDMNSVLGIGENILFIHEGCAAWKGTKDEVLRSDNELLRSFLSPALRLSDR